MYTKEIELEEVTLEEFERMEEFWKIRVRKRDDTIYSKITKTIVEEDYERLLFFLLEHPYADELCVNNNGDWVKRYTRFISESEVREIARIASRDRFKKNYLELKFKVRGVSHTERAILGFAEFNGFIIGSEVGVPLDLECLFTVRYSAAHQSGYRFIRGLWVPTSFN